MIGPYGSSTAFRVALEARLRQTALETRVPLDRLRKEVAIQRMIARLAATDRADGWVLKGALVLLVRLDQAALGDEGRRHHLALRHRPARRCAR